MGSLTGIPREAAIAIDDMLDSCVKLQAGQEVLIAAHIDGLHGGDNLVDEEAVSWIQAAVEMRGANASILWIDEVSRPHAWRFPPVLKAAIEGSDVLINNLFDLAFEEVLDFKRFLWEKKKLMVRNFATTAPLLRSTWAMTPHELVSEIRYQAALPIREGMEWQLTDDNGTQLEGRILPAYSADHPWFTAYSVRREEVGYYRPWPEWVHPPVRISQTAGVFLFDRMLSWWSRYIGISPYFHSPIRLVIENNRIAAIEGGEEANALKRFLASMRERLGDGVYDFNALHFGVHPQAAIEPHQCPHVLYRRLIDHSHSSNIHVHIGAPEATSDYPYWMHITGDIRAATFRVGDTLIHDHGRLFALDHPAVRAVAAKYPGRPGAEQIHG